MAKIEPLMTMAEIYGKDLFYSPRIPSNMSDWLPQDEATIDSLTAGQLTIMGELPVLCARGVSTRAGLQLLETAGLPVPASCYQYADGQDYFDMLSGLISVLGSSVAVQHVHMCDDLPVESSWVRPDLLSFLNNKGNLAALVPERYLPGREVVSVRDLTKKSRLKTFPLVFKAVTDQSSGGGCDVVICRSAEELPAIERLFSSCDQVVAEEYLDIGQNLCLNYAVFPTGEVTFLGAAEQVVDDRGNYLGNWIEKGLQVPDEAVEAGRQLAAEGFTRGFWGCVGIDVAVLNNGGICVYDLNFRVNGSTAALLLADSIFSATGSRVARLCSMKSTISYEAMLEVAYRAIDDKIFLPLGSYDPVAGGQKGAPSRLSGLVLGENRTDVGRHLDFLAKRGVGSGQNCHID